MATTMMKSSNPAIAAMHELMRRRIEAEPQLALKMANPSKSMEGAINFLYNEVKKSGLTVLSDKDVEAIFSLDNFICLVALMVKLKIQNFSRFYNL